LLQQFAEEKKNGEWRRPLPLAGLSGFQYLPRLFRE
jgi:hypothetical protein